MENATIEDHKCVGGVCFCVRYTHRIEWVEDEEKGRRWTPDRTHIHSVHPNFDLIFHPYMRKLVIGTCLCPETATVEASLTAPTRPIHPSDPRKGISTAFRLTYLF